MNSAAGLRYGTAHPVGGQPGFVYRCLILPSRLRLSQQRRAEVQDVVGQRTPQRHALHLSDSAHRDLGQPAITSQVALTVSGVELFVPPKSAKNPQNRGRELEPKRGDSEAVAAWKRRMSSEAGKEIYQERAARHCTTIAICLRSGVRNRTAGFASTSRSFMGSLIAPIPDGKHTQKSQALRVTPLKRSALAGTYIGDGWVGNAPLPAAGARQALGG